MSEERSQFAQRIDEHKFSLSRRGYDKREVRDFLEDLEQAFRELEGHVKRTSQRVGELERDLSKARATERVSVDNAMMAVFDAKDRILERARRRSDEIEEEAHAEAGRIKAAALTGAGGADGAEAGELAAARAQADEIVAAARREADRLRRDSASDATEDLEAELVATTAQLRRAHDDTASAREELDSARRRIVELESGVDGEPSADLEQKFAELESHLSVARRDAERLEEELRTRDQQVGTLQDAVAAAEQALGESQSYLVGTERDLEAKSGRITGLENELAVMRAELESVAAAQADGADFNARMRSTESNLHDSLENEDQAELVAELMRASSARGEDSERISELQAAMSITEAELALAQETIAELQTRQTERESPESSEAEADTIVAAARKEAEEITADAEEQAEQRAAKVIAKAREEADQVRQTVANLTAQADDARSAALRSKIEAEDLAEAQRSISDAREDIVGIAESRAREIEAEAERAQEKAEQALSRALAKAEQLQTESAEKAQAVISGAEARAVEIIAAAEASVPHQPAAEDPDAGKDLAALLAEAEQEVAMSEELRRQREELDLREEELTERERILAAHQADAAKITIPGARHPESAADTAAATNDPSFVEASLETDVAPQVHATPGGAETRDDDEDPADFLSALLEQVVPVIATESAEPVDLDEISRQADDEPRPRMAWPTPVRPTDKAADDEGSAEDNDEDDDAEKPRESRYRSRSAQLPRLGDQAQSNMATMANLRKKSRGAND